MVLKSVKTFMKHNASAKFYFFCNDNIIGLEKFGTVINYDPELLKDFGIELCGYKHVSLACFVRFLIPKYLPNLDRVLYVDCDTLCRKSIKFFYNIDFEDNYIIGVQGIEKSKEQARELGLKFYINSGVLLFNVSLMNKENYFQQILDTWKGCIGLPKIFSADETIINYVFHDKIKLVSEKYNYCYQRNYGDRVLPLKDIVILHITGRSKNNFFKF